MELEERVTSALRAQTEPLPPFAPDVAIIRASAKAQTRRRAAIVLATAVAAVVAVIAVVTSELTTPVRTDPTLSSRSVRPAAPRPKRPSRPPRAAGRPTRRTRTASRSAILRAGPRHPPSAAGASRPT